MQDTGKAEGTRDSEIRRAIWPDCDVRHRCQPHKTAGRQLPLKKKEDHSKKEDSIGCAALTLPPNSQLTVALKWSIK